MVAKQNGSYKGFIMKKLFILALISLFVLSACGKKADDAASDAKPEAAADAKADDSKAAVLPMIF